MSHGATHSGPSLALTLLRRRPPPWCSGVLVSDALLVFSLLLLGSLSLIMSYWRQKRAITPGGNKGEQSRVLAGLLHSHEHLLLGTELQTVSHLHDCNGLPLASGLCLLHQPVPLPAIPFTAAGLVFPRTTYSGSHNPDSTTRVPITIIPRLGVRNLDSDLR